MELRPSALIKANADSLRQTVRVIVATAAAFAAYKALGLHEGYWAVFTVLIVMQASIGGTLGAATDRLLGTLLGAVLGGIGAALGRTDTLELGLVLVTVTGIAALVASVRPRLRIAPVTAAIMLLSAPPGSSVEIFVRDRIIEIGLGGMIGVLAAMLILPARSHGVVIARTLAVLSHIERMLRAQADALTTGLALPSSPEHAALRHALAASFQRPEAGLEHAVKMPDLPPPEELRSLDILAGDYAGISAQAVAFLGQPSAFDIRPCGVPAFLQTKPGTPVSHVWIRFRGSVPTDPVVRRSVLAYLSD